MPVETLGRTYRPKEINPEPASQGLVLRGSLAKEIGYFCQNWQTEGLPWDWADLPGTGFQIQTQLNLLFPELRNINSEEKKREKINQWLSQTSEDIKGFALEYLALGLVFPIFYKIDWVDGEKRIVAPLYGNKKMADTVSWDERNGMVKKTLLEKIEPFLLNAPNESIAVMTSPSGWSGLKDGKGKEIVYPDSQTYIFQKKDEEIVGFTIRTDFSYGEHREFLKRADNKELTLNSSVSDYVSSVVLKERNSELNNLQNIEDVVDLMRDVRFDLSGGSLFTYKKRFWAEVYSNLERRDELWKFDEHTQKIVTEFKEFIMSSELSMEQIKEALAVTILRVAKFLRGEKKQRRPIESSFIPVSLDISYGKILSEVQEIPGCAGGGNTGLVNSLTPRLGETIFGEDFGYEFDQDGPCKTCGADVKCGPCGICRSCDVEIRRKENFKMAA